ncbi:zinc finger protein 236-like isoform X2 [Toxorhynchites rutilus septentrionalis]|uniref:zinc finger protein 236-like isoform X2 n=1 Tax=Toxorhynchites rutilus septentrionalis TaxID=329112 RepID=UPI0024795D8A|nr:zinc finger protein 236-like isoform X2 [Toxorhynchites rutilus septentrionalis]
METHFSSCVSDKNITPTGPNICRICLQNGGPVGIDGDNTKEMESILTTIGEYEDRSLYSIMMTICAPLGYNAVPEDMPDRICRSCKWRLLSAYELYEICLRSDEKIREIMESKKERNTDQISVKEEMIDPDDQDYNNGDTGGLENSLYMMREDYCPTTESTQISDNPADLLEEMQMIVDPNETLFEANYKFDNNGSHCCRICGQEFIYKSQCRFHIIVKHDPTKPFKCDVCHYTLTTELQLNRHKTMTHGEEGILNPVIKEKTDESVDTIYTCKICPKIFTSIVRFKRHRNTHNRPFGCNICLHHFPNRAQLNRHVKVHQKKPAGADGGNQQNEWKCDYCDENLSSKRNLIMHIRRSHRQELQDAAKKKNSFKCIICPKVFARENVFNIHMKIHELLDPEKDKEQTGSCSVGPSKSSSGGVLGNSAGSVERSDEDMTNQAREHIVGPNKNVTNQECEPVRLQAQDWAHFPKSIDPTPRKKHPTRMCKVCYKHKIRSETKWECATCKVALHLPECFRSYHTMEDY